MNARAAAAVVCSACTLMLLSGCASSAPATSGTSPHQPTTSPTPQLAGTVRTVLSPLGLNIRSDPSKTAMIAGVAAQGALLTVLDYRAGNGGWYRVQGQTVTGWVIADPSLTAAGQLTSYQSARGFSSLYPADWTFAEEPQDTLFHPQQGSRASIVVRTAPTTAAFGQPLPGYASTFLDDSLVVCGYTGRLAEYARSASAAPASASPNGSTAVQLQYYATLRLRFDSAHAIELAFNYENTGQLRIFEDFYNAITFPYPQCQAPASPAPSPT